MGRRIFKSQRHKKFKFVDPCYNGRVPNSRKRELLPNEPPTEDDYQEVPHHAEEIIEMKNEMKKNMFKKKKKKKKKKLKDDFIIVKTGVIDKNEHGPTKISKVPDVIKQRKYENKDQFLNRLQRMADKALAEAKVEEKYNIQLLNVDDKGNAQYITQAKQVSEGKKRKRKKEREKEVVKKRTKTEDKEFDFKKEDIQFGEVVTAPPILTAKPRKAPAVDKPGKKKLALKEILESSAQMENASNPKSLSIKWKNMHPKQRETLEHERLRAVQMYRMLKSKKSNS